MVHTTKLAVYLEVLFVENLENGVEQAAQGRIGGLLDSLRTSAASIVLRDDRRHAVDVHDVFGALLVRATKDKAELVRVNADSLQDVGDAETVEDGALLHNFDGSLEIVEESMDISQEDRDLATSGKQLRNLDGGNEVSAVRATGRGGSYKFSS